MSMVVPSNIVSGKPKQRSKVYQMCISQGVFFLVGMISSRMVSRANQNVLQEISYWQGCVSTFYY